MQNDQKFYLLAYSLSVGQQSGPNLNATVHTTCVNFSQDKKEYADPCERLRFFLKKKNHWRAERALRMSPRRVDELDRC